MPNPSDAPRLAESLVFRQRWWWDPVPDWIIHTFDKTVLRELAVIQLEVQRTVLEAQLKATERILGTLGKMK